MNAKRKGNVGQSKFANFLKEHGFSAMSDGSRSGGGMYKGDIHNDQDICYEVKTCKKINLQECWRQVTRDATLSRSTPVLAVHFDGMPEGEWLMVMHSEDWVESMKGNNAKAQNFTDPKLKWALTTLKNAIGSVMKLLP